MVLEFVWSYLSGWICLTNGLTKSQNTDNISALRNTTVMFSCVINRDIIEGFEHTAFKPSLGASKNGHFILIPERSISKSL